MKAVYGFLVMLELRHHSQILTGLAGIDSSAAQFPKSSENGNVSGSPINKANSVIVPSISSLRSSPPKKVCIILAHFLLYFLLSRFSFSLDFGYQSQVRFVTN